MSDKVKLHKLNEVYFKVEAPASVKREMHEEFAFFVDGYKFNPKFRAKAWDGKIRLFNLRESTIYAGLFEKIKDFCEERDYELSWDYSELSETEFSETEARDFVKSIVDKAPEDLDVRDYQLETFMYCIRKNRALFLSPTSSGKSFMIYLIVAFYLRSLELPALIIVDSTAAVGQMIGDFISYGHDASDIHGISGGKEKNTRHPIIVSTWQSLLKQDPEWFDRFGVVIGDEAHHYKATAMKAIMESARNARYRFGFTGTLDGIPTNKLVLEGLFGKVKQIVTTKQLQDMGYVAELIIKCIVLQYSDASKNKVRPKTKEEIKKAYETETQFLINSEARNRFIKNLALSCEGNTLIFFVRVEDHGRVIFDMIGSDPKSKDKRLYFIHGGVDGDIRNEIRKELEDSGEPCIFLKFGKYKVRAGRDEEVPLEDGSIIRAKNVTTDSDVSSSWIINKLKIQTGTNIDARDFY